MRFEHRVVTFYTCFTFISKGALGKHSKTCPIFIENTPNMSDKCGLGDVGSVCWVIGVVFAGLMDAGWRFLSSCGSF
jgi:hypothetical protein